MDTTDRVESSFTFAMMIPMAVKHAIGVMKVRDKRKGVRQFIIVVGILFHGGD